jgi:hypothetical protein
MTTRHNNILLNTLRHFWQYLHYHKVHFIYNVAAKQYRFFATKIFLRVYISLPVSSAYILQL